jgi:glycosyltransferase involved in cell wall biosynthesis
MKIFYDYQIFFNQKYGGPSKYFFKLATNIIKNKDIELKICAPFYKNNYLKKISDKNIFGIKLNGGSFINKYFLSNFNKYLSGLYINYFKPDIIHSTYYDHTYNIKKPIVITVYDLIHEIFFKDYKKNIDFRPKKLAIEKADLIICISNNTFKDLNKFYDIKNKKIKIIYLGYNVDQLKVNKCLNKFEKKYLLYVGDRKNYKNFQSLLKIYALNKRIQQDFDIIFFGSQPFSKPDYDYMNDLKINLKNIRQISGNDDILHELYKNATCLIYPSYYEGFGLPILEAMSHGCPVLCSNTSSMPEVGGDAVEYFDPYSLEQMNDVIMNVVYSNSKLNDLKQKGFSRSKLFSLESCSIKTIEAYKEIS